MGNIGSIVNMIRKIGYSAKISSDYRLLKKADKIILPGVGHFDRAMYNLKKLDLIDVLQERAIQDNIPTLGICLGMHLLCKFSEEGTSDGLSIINAHVEKFKFDPKQNYKIPHMEWNTVTVVNDHEIFIDNDQLTRFYFAHSYHTVCANSEDVLTTTNYGYDFPSSICKGNVIGVQFHPEKSHKYGMQLLKRFIELPV